MSNSLIPLWFFVLKKRLKFKGDEYEYNTKREYGKKKYKKFKSGACKNHG